MYNFHFQSQNCLFYSLISTENGDLVCNILDFCHLIALINQPLTSVFWATLSFTRFACNIMHKTRAPHTVPTLACQGHHSLKFKLIKGQNSKITAFRFMPLVLQLNLVMMSKYSKFGVDTLSTFSVMGYIKVFARQRSSNHNSFTFSSKQTS